MLSWCKEPQKSSKIRRRGEQIPRRRGSGGVRGPSRWRGSCEALRQRDEGLLRRGEENPPSWGLAAWATGAEWGVELGPWGAWGGLRVFLGGAGWVPPWGGCAGLGGGRQAVADWWRRRRVALQLASEVNAASQASRWGKRSSFETSPRV
jgi:hypothetical protein